MTTPATGRSGLRRAGRGTVLLVCALAGITAAAARNRVSSEVWKERRGISDGVRLSIGGFLMQFDTKTQFQSEELGTGGTVSLENALGLNNQSVDLRVFGHFRFHRNHRIFWDYMAVGRSANKTLEQQIEYDDEIFPAGAMVDTTFDTRLLQLGYLYSFVNNGKFEAGLLFGLSTYGFDTTVTAAGSVSVPGQDVSGDGRAAVDLIAPVPTLGVFFDWTIRPKMFLSTSFDGFHAASGTWDAGLRELKMVFDHYPWKHVGYGIGLDAVRLRYIQDKENHVEVRWGYDGILAYVSFIW